jgi:hypothetical protein
VTGADTHAFEDVELPVGGHRYFYRVSALDASGRSPPSGAANMVNRPAAPTGVALVLSGRLFVVNWRDTSGETGYRVERRTTHADGSTGAWDVIGAVGANVPSLSDLAVSAAEAYQYRVIATSPFGDSDPAETGGPLIPSSLTGLRIAVRLPTEVGLAWDAMDGATYSLERSLDGRNFEPLATSTTAAYTDRDVAPARRYYYRVTATTAAATTATSEVLAVTTPNGTALPEGWEAADVGAPASGFDGGAVNFGAEGATLSITGSGAGILTSPTDSFSFVYRRMTNASIVARIAVWDFQPGTGLAGVMVRTSTAPGAACAFVGMRAQAGAFYQSRASGSASATGAAPTAATVEPAAGRPPVWVRLERRGSFVAGFVSSDGIAWGPLPNLDVSFEGPVLVGFAVTAGQRTGAYSATFDNVRVVEDFSPIVAAASAAFAFESPTQLNLWASATDGTAASGLSYTWSVVRAPPGIPPAAAARFSDNGTNAARHAMATVSRPATTSCACRPPTANTFPGLPSARSTSTRFRRRSPSPRPAWWSRRAGPAGFPPQSWTSSTAASGGAASTGRPPPAA